MDLKSKIFLIYGPTASGTSDFAIKLAKKIKGEIINSDSMQVYRELQILTARPTKKDFQKIDHKTWTTSLISGIISFSFLSIPIFNVMVLLGQLPHAP